MDCFILEEGYNSYLKETCISEVLEGPDNANKLVVPSDSELVRKTLADSYELLLELVGDLILIQKNLSINKQKRKQELGITYIIIRVKMLDILKKPAILSLYEDSTNEFKISSH
ncbi:hypothetical protein C1646_762992 [Rhizophagus diaphanus]|nr:hypothetical protein C1646_762992 [Rhizophagus diaphanus] [Rhizophagus sp. MUCL 43196]